MLTSDLNISPGNTTSIIIERALSPVVNFLKNISYIKIMKHALFEYWLYANVN